MESARPLTITYLEVGLTGPPPVIEAHEEPARPARVHDDLAERVISGDE